MRTRLRESEIEQRKVDGVYRATSSLLPAVNPGSINDIASQTPISTEEERRMTTRMGEHCRCGRVGYQVSGDPNEVGICHCTDCGRKAARRSFILRHLARRPSTIGASEVYARKDGVGSSPLWIGSLFSLDAKREAGIGSACRWKTRRVARNQATNCGSNAGNPGCSLSRAPSSMGGPAAPNSEGWVALEPASPPEPEEAAAAR